MTDAPKHPANPDPGAELESNASSINPRDFRNALGTFATGVTIITASTAEGKPYGLTCNSFASVSLNPPLVLWSLGMFSQGLTVFQNASHFAVNVLGASQQALASKFAKSSEDKFAGVGWSTSVTGSALIDGVIGYVDCTVHDVHEAGDHYLVVGRVVDLRVLREGEPLLYHRGGYRTAGPEV